MRFPKAILFPLLLASCLAAAGKDKKKILLPADVLEAQTVLVVVDPGAGMAPEAPNANRTAQEAVENALMAWGRFRLATDVSTADLVIMIRKGNGKIAQPTIGGLPNNNRPVILEPSDSGGRIGGSRGTPPSAGDPTAPSISSPGPQIEVGQSEDLFAVYRGKRDNVLDAPSVWRYQAKDALRSPSVPAVDAFRKLVVEAEKQRAAKP
ncbi:MAG TPA: hypothetical protein VGL22_20030 [Terracidiphilus sp.]|jgi:hypothetical protein